MHVNHTRERSNITISDLGGRCLEKVGKNVRTVETEWENSAKRCEKWVGGGNLQKKSVISYLNAPLPACSQGRWKQKDQSLHSLNDLVDDRLNFAFIRRFI